MGSCEGVGWQWHGEGEVQEKKEKIGRRWLKWSGAVKGWCYWLVRRGRHEGEGENEGEEEGDGLC